MVMRNFEKKYIVLQQIFYKQLIFNNVLHLAEIKRKIETHWNLTNLIP